MSLHDVSSLTFSTIEAFFPFAFSVDQSLAICDVGKSLRKISQDFIPGSPLADVLAPDRPGLKLSLEYLGSCLKRLLILKFKYIDVSLRGQIVDLENRLLFLVSPTFESNEQVAEFGLKLSDFAIHDLTLENLFLRQHQQLQLEDHRRMVSRLKDALAERNRLVELEHNLAHDLAAAGDIMFRFDAQGMVLDARCVQDEALPFNPSEVVGKQMSEIAPELIAFVNEHQEDLAESDHALAFEFCFSDELIFDSRIARTRENHLLLLGRNVTERRKMEQALEYRSLHDPLTDLANRELFTREIDEAIRSESNCSLIFIDIDDFKMVNDTYGHLVADDLLRQLSERMRECIGSTDLAARLGGDEFGILLRSHHTVESATQTATKLLIRLREPIEIETNVIVASASIGVAIAEPEMLPAALIRNADVAMYEAKADRKNCVKAFEQSMMDDFQERNSNQNEIRNAVENCEIAPYYQTVFDLQDKSTIGVEALARWRHPTKGLLEPGQFIPEAEKSDLICTLGQHILSIACHEIAHLNRTHGLSLSLNVNVSPRQFALSDFAETVHHVLSLTGLDARLLCLEITEHLMIENFEVVCQNLEELIDLGVSIALDDFGTGFSSLLYLEKLPIQSIKLDRVFVKDMEEHPQRTALIRGTVQMAESMGLKIVAEGIENANQAAVLEKLGCHFGQGYLYSKAMHLPTLIDLLKREFEEEPQDDQTQSTSTSPSPAR